MGRLLTYAFLIAILFAILVVGESWLHLRLTHTRPRDN